MGKVRAGLAAVAVAASSLAVAGVAITTGAAPAGASPFTIEQPTDLVIPFSGTVQSTLNVPADTCQSPLNDVNVGITWNHTFNNDLQWQLTSPGGETVLLLDDEGGSTDNGAVLYDDEAELLASAINDTQPSGWRRPLGSLSTYDGDDVTGNWTLTIADQSPGDMGALTDWTLQFNCFDESADLPFVNMTASAIPDNGATSSFVTVDECDTVTHVAAEAVFQHTLMSDLRFELTHAGTTVLLWDSNLVQERGGWLTFDDDATLAVQDVTVTNSNPGNAWPATAFVRPDQPLAAFEGTDGAGDWTLTVRDVVGQDVGQLQQFGLDLECTPDEPPPPTLQACDDTMEDGFTDLAEDATHEDNVDCIAFYGIAQGQTATTYNPTGRVSRAQIATFVARMLRVAGVDLPANPPDAFPGDDAGAPHELSIDQLAAIGIIGGNGETGDRYNPTVDMRRDHMASFLVRAYEAIIGVPLAAGPDAFTDDDGNAFEADIDALAAAGVVQGTGGTNYDPAGTVSRASMGSFLARTLQLILDDGATITPL